jgi:hypothetical protein
MKMNITISDPPKFNTVVSYPYWAINTHGDLFLITGPENGIAVQYWTAVQDISMTGIKPLTPGTVVTIQIL